MASKAAKPEKPRKAARREPCPETPDPIDLAMKLAASGRQIPDIARTVLHEHAQLIRAQRDELRLRKIGEGVRAALWAMLGFVALALLALIAAVVTRASRSDALIVQSFRVPPALAGRGLSGEVVAAQVLDELAKMQKSTESIRAPSTYANNWENDLSIDIPNTRTTTDQVWKLLRGWLGKETRISGELVLTGTGLALTARVGANPGRRFVGGAGDLDALVTEAAELIYEQTQPYRYSMYLNFDPGSAAERYAVLRRLSRDPSPVERKWAFNGLAVDRRNQGDIHGSIVMAKKAISIDPKMQPAYANLALAYRLLGRDQESVDAANQLQRLPVSDELDPVIGRSSRCGMRATVGQLVPDPPSTLEAAACLAINSTAPGAQQEIISRAYYALYRHEPWLTVTVPPSPNARPALTAYRTQSMRLRAQMSAGSRTGILRALQAFEPTLAAIDAPDTEKGWPRTASRIEATSVHAEALLMVGRLADAKAIIERTPLDCYHCLRVRGKVAQSMNRPDEAQRWYSKAVEAGPRLAFAYVDWARLLAAHGRFEGAEHRFAKAAAISPNWADPLKYWGDALAAQGKRDEATEKYDAALKLAPNWAELKQARAKVVR